MLPCRLLNNQSLKLKTEKVKDEERTGRRTQANCDEARDKMKKEEMKKKTGDDDGRLAEGRWERLIKGGEERLEEERTPGWSKTKGQREEGSPPNPPSRHRFWPVKVSLHAITAAGDRL